jgi:hypothetical protein
MSVQVCLNGSLVIGIKPRAKDFFFSHWHHFVLYTFYKNVILMEVACTPFQHPKLRVASVTACYHVGPSTILLLQPVPRLTKNGI